MRPDEHPELQAMGKGEPTCDMCIGLFPLASADVCNDCNLNPMADGLSEDFVRAVLGRAEQLSLPEAWLQVALGDLAGAGEEE